MSHLFLRSTGLHDLSGLTSPIRGASLQPFRCTESVLLDITCCHRSHINAFSCSVKCLRGMAAMGNTPSACAAMLCCVHRLKSQSKADIHIGIKRGVSRGVYSLIEITQRGLGAHFCNPQCRHVRVNVLKPRPLTTKKSFSHLGHRKNTTTNRVYPKAINQNHMKYVLIDSKRDCEISNSTARPETSTPHDA